MNDQLAAVIDKIATKLGVGAEILWSAMLVQAKIDAAMCVFALVIIWAVIFFAWRKALSLEDRFDIEPLIVLMTIATGGALIASALLASSAATGFFNPEFWALKQIIK